MSAEPKAVELVCHELVKDGTSRKGTPWMGSRAGRRTARAESSRGDHSGRFLSSAVIGREAPVSCAVAPSPRRGRRSCAHSYGGGGSYRTARGVSAARMLGFCTPRVVSQSGLQPDGGKAVSGRAVAPPLDDGSAPSGRVPSGRIVVGRTRRKGGSFGVGWRVAPGRTGEIGFSVGTSSTAARSAEARNGFMLGRGCGREERGDARMRRSPRRVDGLSSRLDAHHVRDM